jgi:hypothetical protein
MMGETQVGGNLSVHWLVNADDVDPADEAAFIESRRLGPKHRAWIQHGADYHSKSALCGDNFTVRIKLPDDADRFITSVLRGLADAKTKGRLEFELTIEKGQVAHTQIQIAWAGGKKSATAPQWSDGLSQTPPGTGNKSGKSTKASRSSKQAT